MLTDRLFSTFLSLNVALAAAIASTIYVAVIKLQHIILLLLNDWSPVTTLRYIYMILLRNIIISFSCQIVFIYYNISQNILNLKKLWEPNKADGRQV